jgi:hypothetical protein
MPSAKCDIEIAKCDRAASCRLFEPCKKVTVADRMIVSSAMTQTAAAAVAFCDDKPGRRCASSWGSDGPSPGDD